MVKVRRRQEGSSVPFPCLSLVLASPSMLRCLPNAQKPALGAKKQKQEVPGGPSITRFFDPRPAGTSPVVGSASLYYAASTAACLAASCNNCIACAQAKAYSAACPLVTAGSDVAAVTPPGPGGEGPAHAVQALGPTWRPKHLLEADMVSIELRSLRLQCERHCWCVGAHMDRALTHGRLRTNVTATVCSA